MTRIRRILLDVNGKFYPLFIIGYINSGYFVESLISREDDEHLIVKMPVPKHEAPLFKIMYEDCKYWSTKCRPKMTHHTSGDAQISKAGKIYSGFYKLINRAKGVHLKTMRLLVDSGTCFGYNIWGFEHFTDVTPDENDIIIDENIQGMQGGVKTSGNISANIQAYFLPKDYIEHNLYDVINSVVSFNHKNFGMIPLKCISAPDNCPGFIALSCLWVNNYSNEKPFGYTFTGATTYGPDDGPYTMFNIIFPKDRDIKAKSLDYEGMNKVVANLDNFLFKLLLKLRITKNSGKLIK